MGQTIKIQEAQGWLFRALRTIPKTENDIKIDILSRRIWVELMLSCEEQSHMESAQLVAQAAFEFSSIKGWSSDGMQRPGYVYNLTEHEEQIFHNIDRAHVLTRKPFYFEDDQYRPSWCKVLEDNYEFILKDFMNLLENYKEEGQNDNGVRVGRHWPKVGSGEHRNSGHNDARVVNKGGDWREMVLFGTGAIAGAEFTKNLIRRHIPDAVSLANMGGGEVIFSLLQPKTIIAPHCASTNIRLTAHLGLVVPPPIPHGYPQDCFIRVGDACSWANWEPGKVLIFDDSFEHEVCNRNETMYRAVLLLRFWHPSITQHQKALDHIYRCQQLDKIRRFNPPLLVVQHDKIKISQSIQIRSFGGTACLECGKNGYEHVRCVLLNDEESYKLVLKNESTTGKNDCNTSLKENEDDSTTLFVCSCGVSIS